MYKKLFCDKLNQLLWEASFSSLERDVLFMGNEAPVKAKSR